MILGSTQPLIEMGTRGISWQVGRTDSLAIFMSQLSKNCGKLKFLEL